MSKEEKISVNPIPASGHDNIHSSVTTSEEDYNKVGTSSGSSTGTSKGREEQVSINPVPASGHNNTQSSTTRSKEDYDRIG